MNTWKDTVRQEIAKGGTAAPCPFCHLPRVRRSDYIRCCRCGINWMEGEALDHDPRQQRFQAFLDSTTATAKKKPTEQP
jgi:hypothetical protein